MDLPGETTKTDLGNGIIVEQHHLRTGVEFDVRRMGISVKTMRSVAMVRALLFDVIEVLFKERRVAQERLRQSRLEATAPNQRAAPIRTKPGGSPPGTTGTGWPTPAVLFAYGMGVLSGGVAAIIIFLSQQG